MKPFEDLRLDYLSALGRLRDALVREMDMVQIGQESLQSTSDAVSTFRGTRQAYCQHLHEEERP